METVVGASKALNMKNKSAPSQISTGALEQQWGQNFDGFWQSFIQTQYGEAESSNPLAPVIRYILEGPGKRVRAKLCLLSAELCRGPNSLENATQLALIGATAVEMVHAYSLVHDDLPCMDNDDYRRGRPTAHRAFDEARALLAGDAILTDAFAVLANFAEEQLELGNESSARAVHRMLGELASASGSRGMALGQSLDLHWTGRPDGSLTDLIDIHSGKTAWLLGASCAMGAWAAGSSAETTENLRTAGRKAGLAFQIIDDLIDDNPTTGKSQGKDLKSGKLTYLSLLGRDRANQTAQDLTQEALSTIDQIAAAGDSRVRSVGDEFKVFLENILCRNS